MLLFKMYNNKKLLHNETTILNFKYNEISNSIPIYNNHFAKLVIPTIKLEEYLVSYKSKDNNVNKSITILFPSVMPDNPNSLLILAAHSGNSRISYFKDLDKLKIGNKARIHYKNKIYGYKVTYIERQNKNGLITIKKKKINLY